MRIVPDQAPVSGPLPLHPDVAQLGFLLGTWAGQGEGDYPTISPFRYTEESIFWHVGKPYIGYRQRTWKADDGFASHSESGYWRSPGEGQVELVVAHHNGLVEVAEGHLELDSDREEAVVETASTVIAGTRSAKDVSSLARRITVTGDALAYTLEMAAVGVPLGFHLEARLSRSNRGSLE